jgi:hypothetical protein
MQYGKLIFTLGGIQIHALYCIDMTPQSFLHYFQKDKAFKFVSVKVPDIQPELTQNKLY